MANWWKRLSQKAAPAPVRGAMAWFETLAGQTDGWRGYVQATQDGYVRNPVAGRAVRLVSESLASAPLRITQSGQDIAAILAQPNSLMSGTGFLEAIAVYLMLHGNAFIEMIEDGEGQLAHMHVLRPERVEIETDAKGWPLSYCYRAGHHKRRLPAGPGGALHISLFHPLDDHYGLGCLESAANAIAMHNAAQRWNRALLDNAARPSGALMFEGEPMAADQFQRLKTEMAEGFSGAIHAGRPMLLEGGLKWQPLSLSPADMDFAQSQATAARDIALAFGVPPMLLGLPGDNTYANYREANRALWRLTVLPLLTRITQSLCQHLQWWSPGLRIDVDRDSIAALSEDRERLWAQVASATFLSDAEKRQMLGLDPAP